MNNARVPMNQAGVGDTSTKAQQPTRAIEHCSIVNLAYSPAAALIIFISKNDEPCIHEYLVHKYPKQMEEILKFLTDLSKNNNREWFNEHKPYFLELKEKFEVIVQQYIDALSLVDNNIAHLKAKDCIFRIYKDVRFSKDKSPYKTHFGAYINEDGRKGKLCGYYLHLEPGATLLAGGVYGPPSDILYEIRDAIYADTDDYKKIIDSAEFKATFGEVEGAKLKRGPKDFPKDFEDIDLLKFKSYLIMKRVTDDEILKDNFFDNSIEIFTKMRPFNDFLNRAIKNM